MMAGCGTSINTGEPDLALTVKSPAEYRIATDQAFAIADYPDNGDVRIYIDDRGARRLSVVTHVTVGTFFQLGVGSDVTYRDAAAGIDCASFVGTLLWTPTPSIEITGDCRAKPDVHLSASLTGAFVRYAMDRPSF